MCMDTLIHKRNRIKKDFVYTYIHIYRKSSVCIYICVLCINVYIYILYLDIDTVRSSMVIS